LKAIVDVEGKKGKKIENHSENIDYSLILCASCFFEGNVPIILSSNNF